MTRGGSRGAAVGVLATLALLMTAPPAHAEPTIADLAATDVTPRAFALVWAADEPVTDARVRLFAEPEGTTDLTAEFSQTLVSSDVPSALALGLVKVDIDGAVPSTCVYVQAETESSTGTARTPEAPPFVQVCTQARVRRDDPLGQPIVNDLLRHELRTPDGTAPAAGALVLLEAPDVGGSPLSAFVGEGFRADQAVLNLNDLFYGGSGETTSLGTGAPLRLRELRGALCPLSEQARVRYRRLPPHEEVATVGYAFVQVEPPERCFFADTDCSGTVEEADAERVLDGLDSSRGGCRFNPDLDSVPDEGIDVLDVQRVLNRVGQAAP